MPVDRIRLDTEVSVEKKHDRSVCVSAGSEIKLTASSITLSISSESFTWFLSSKRERERETQGHA